MIRVLWLAIICSLALTPCFSIAQPTNATQLPAIEVQDERLGEMQLIRETSAFANVIDTQDATERVDSVSEILAESVGVQVRRFGGLGAFSTVSIRGSTPNQVDIFLDGVRLNQANAGLVDLGALSLDGVERIEIYRGFAPLELGAGSIGGAVNLVTRRIAGKTLNRVSTSYGSFNTRKLALYRSQGFDKWGYTGLFNYAESDNDFEFLDDNGTPLNLRDDEMTARTNNDFRSFSGNFKGEAKLAGWDLTFSDDWFTKDQGVPGQSSIQSTDARLGIWRNVATLRLNRKSFPWPTTDIGFQLSHSWQRESFKDPLGEVGIGRQDDHDTSHLFSAQSLLNLYIEPWNHVVGVFLEGSYETFRTVEKLLTTNAKGPLQTRTNLIVAWQDEILLFDERLAIRPLLRYQFVTSDFGAQPLFLSVQLDQDRNEIDHLFSPSLGVKYALTSFLDFKGNIGQFQRVPTLFELFGDRGTTRGNPDLTAESSLNWDVGFSLQLPRYAFINRVFFEYAYFTNKSDDLILFVQTSQAAARAQNISSATIRGHELSWSLTAWNHLRLYGNYTFQDAADTSDTFSRDNTLPGRPRHELHQAVELFSDIGKVVYEWDYFARNFLDQANAFVVNQRTLHNLRLTLNPFGKGLTFTFEAKNITNNQVEDFRGFPLPGRSFFGTIEGRF